MTITLRSGQFYGLPQFSARGEQFAIRALAATRPERDAQVHTHEDAHFVFVLSGAYITSATGAPTPVRSPTLVFNPPHTTHRDRFAGGVGTFMTISVPAAIVRGATGYFSAGAIRMASPKELGAAFGIARELRGGRDEAVMDSLVWELLSRVGSRDRLRCDPPRWALRAFETIMDCPLVGCLSVLDVAADVDVHPAHLARVFRGFWGCSPAELARWRRADCAARLLVRSKLPGVDIAAAAGFSDQSHMSRDFRMAYGFAPGAYRRQHVSRMQDCDSDPAIG